MMISEKAAEKEESSDRPHATADSNGTEKAHVPTEATRLPWVSWTQGLAVKASAWELKSWAALAMTLDGRDKITKMMQYTARLLSWVWLDRYPVMSDRMTHLKASLTSSRKAYRLGRTLIELEKLRSSSPSWLGLVWTSLQWHLRRLRKLSTDTGPAGDVWIALGSALKTLALGGFWACDNVSFLADTGLFDPFPTRPEDGRQGPDPLVQRKQLQSQASAWANRCYFAGACVGLMVSLRSWLAFRRQALRNAFGQLVAAKAASECQATSSPDHHGLVNDSETRLEEEKEGERSIQQQQQQRQLSEALHQAQSKEFGLWLAVVKSAVDVLVFSNNPGVDAWKNMRGTKMHEGWHCAGGLISAAVVLYNNFPSSSPSSSTLSNHPAPVLNGK